MDQYTISQGQDFAIPIQIRNRDGSATAFTNADTFTARVHRGQDQAPLFAPIVTWDTRDGTQTGYEQGQVLVSGLAADTAALDGAGNYHLEVWWVQQNLPVAELLLTVRYAAGTATQTIVPYCTYQDMLDIAGWISIIQNMSTDQEGFYSQRLQARTWMDWAILNNYRGASVGTLEMHSVMAFNFGGGYGRRRSVGPSPSMIDYLAQDKLIRRPQIVKACAHWACSIVGLAQIGLNNQFVTYGMFHRDMAQREAVSITAEIDLTGTGIGSIFVPLSATNTLFT